MKDGFYEKGDRVELGDGTIGTVVDKLNTPPRGMSEYEVDVGNGNVIPVLSKGILHVCKELPEDPVDALAYYLLDNANNAKFPPHKYKDQK